MRNVATNVICGTRAAYVTRDTRRSRRLPAEIQTLHGRSRHTLQVLVQKPAEYKGRILFDLDASPDSTHGLVCHQPIAGQPPPLNIGHSNYGAADACAACNVM